MEGDATFFRLALNVDVIKQQFDDVSNQIVSFVKSAHQMKGVPPFVVDPVDVDPSFQEELNQLDQVVVWVISTYIQQGVPSLSCRRFQCWWAVERFRLDCGCGSSGKRCGGRRIRCWSCSWFRCFYPGAVWRCWLDFPSCSSDTPTGGRSTLFAPFEFQSGVTSDVNAGFTKIRFCRLRQILDQSFEFHQAR